jgi:hypothetical protein
VSATPSCCFGGGHGEGVVAEAGERNPPQGQGNGPSHREIWVKDPDGYTVVVASPDGEAFEPSATKKPCDDR